MLPTYEALLEPDGRLQFLEATPPPTVVQARRVLVTFTEMAAPPAHADWRHLTGLLKDSPNLNGDPLDIQQAMRHEWD
jgi:hypothetical protein